MLEEKTKAKDSMPLAVLFYLLIVVQNLYGFILSVKYNPSAALAGIIAISPAIYMTAALFNGKKNIHIFIPTVLDVLLVTYNLIRGFSIIGCISLFAHILLAFLVACVVLPGLEGIMSKVKKLFFLPSLMLFILNIINVAGVFASLQIQNVISLWLFPCAWYLLTLWCYDLYEGTSSVKNAQRIFFKVLFLILTVSFIITVIPQKEHKREWSDLEDWEKDNAEWAHYAQQAIDDYER